MNLPDEEKIIKLYKFYFAGIKEPVTIATYNNESARALLVDALRMLPREYGLSKVVSESVSMPLEGISCLRINNVLNVWVGMDFSKTGWMPKKEYLKKISNK